MNRTYQEVPVAVAKNIATEFDKDIVVICCWDRLHGLLHTTTFGVTAPEKVWAGAAGEICCKALGSDLSRAKSYEDFRDGYQPAIQREAIELLATIAGVEDIPDSVLSLITEFTERRRKMEAGS